MMGRSYWATRVVLVSQSVASWAFLLRPDETPRMRSRSARLSGKEGHMNSKHIITAAAIFAMLLSAAQTASSQTVKFFDGLFPSAINNEGKIVGYDGIRGPVVFDSLTGERTEVPIPGPARKKEAHPAITSISNTGLLAGSVLAYFHHLDKNGLLIKKYLSGLLGDLEHVKLYNVRGAIDTQLIAVNDNGDVIGYYVTQTSRGAQPFFQPAGGSPQDVVIPGVGSPGIGDLNNNGDVVANVSRPTYRSFILRRDGSVSEVFVPVANLLGFGLNGINNRGDVVGTFEVNDPVRGQQLQGFAVVGGQFRVIDMGPHTQLMDINDLGEIVGTGERGFVIYPGSPR
jgi:hypothetical protein